MSKSTTRAILNLRTLFLFCQYVL